MTATSQKHSLISPPEFIIRFLNSLRLPEITTFNRFALALLFLVGGLTCIVTARYENQMWIDRQAEVSRTAAGKITEFLADQQRQLTLIGLVAPSHLSSNLDALQALLSEPEGWLGIARLDRTGQLNFSIGSQAFISDALAPTQSDWFLQASQGHNYIGQVQAQPGLLFAVPARDGGVVAGLLNWQALQTLVQPIHLGQSGMVWIVNLRSGAILSQNTAGKLAGPGSAYPLDTALASAAGQEWSGRYAAASGMLVRGRVTPIPGVDWALVTELPVIETRRIFRSTLAGFTLCMVVVGCLAIFNARLMRRLHLAPGNPTFRNRPARLGRGVTGAANPEFNLSSARLAENDQRLVYARSQAIQAGRLKSELLANVSHELRTPLGIILGFAELLRDGRYGLLSAQQREPLAHIVESSLHLNRMINNMLDQSRLDARQLNLTMVLIHPADLIDEVVAPMTLLAQKKGLVFDTSLARDLPNAFYGDPVRLRQIITNLVENGIKFTESGQVSLRIYRPGPDHWAIQVSDSGCGIPPEARDTIFEPFRQVDGSATREHDGAGLGLSIVQHLVELMHGSILLDSQVERGSNFTVLLPIVVSLRKDPQPVELMI